MEINVLQVRPAGYSYLLKNLGLDSVPHWHTSAITATGTHRTNVKDCTIEDIYPNQYWPGERTVDHLEFALKYDGINLPCLYIIFSAINESEIVEYIQSKPTGKYARRIWFFYEFLTGKHLPIDDLKMSNYVEALEPELYYTVTPGKKARRQRILNNFLLVRNCLPNIILTFPVVFIHKTWVNNLVLHTD